MQGWGWAGALLGARWVLTRRTPSPRSVYLPAQRSGVPIVGEVHREVLQDALHKVVGEVQEGLREVPRYVVRAQQPVHLPSGLKMGWVDERADDMVWTVQAGGQAHHAPLHSGPLQPLATRHGALQPSHLPPRFIQTAIKVLPEHVDGLAACPTHSGNHSDPKTPLPRARCPWQQE